MRKRAFLAGLGAALTAMPAIAQTAKTDVPRRMARTTRLFRAPQLYPNALAVDGGTVWIAQQKLKGIQAQGAHVPEQSGPEHVWQLDWSGKLLRTFSSGSEVTSGLAVGGGAIYVIANNEGDYPPPVTGVWTLDMRGNTHNVRQIPLGGGGCHGAQWHDGKLWIVANRLNAMIRIDPASWMAEFAIPIQHDTADTARWHDMTFDDAGFVWCVTGNKSAGYATGRQGLAKYDPVSGALLELVTLAPGSGDPHGLGFHDGAFVACDAGHHPGWPDQDGPDAGWIFRIDLI
jgi:hypothetical protein